MRRLTTLLWRELESLFFSPLAYIVLTVFLVLSGFSFAYALAASAGSVHVTVTTFLGDGPLFWVCLVMVPPLITMRLVSEERRSGTLEVLLTAPVRDGEVITAKFLGALLFQAFLWVPTLLYLAIIRRYGAVPDGGQLFTSYLGIALTSGLLTSVGVLFSTRTGNQIVAAVSALTFNLLFILLPAVVSQSPGLGVLERGVSGISMTRHFSESFSQGLVDSGLLVWYLSATAGVLVMATRSLEARRWR